MKTKKLMQCAVLIIYTMLCSILFGQKKHTVIVKWDDWGVPHITGTSDAETYYGLGWAQMEAHANRILKGFGKSRGRAAEYWGASEGLENDLLVRKLEIPARAVQWYECQSEEIKINLQAFVQGMNDYCAAHPEFITPTLKCVLPIEASDPLAKLQQSYHLKVGGFALEGQASQWKNAGSNAWAIAPAKSVSGHALLLMQPHPVWTDDFMFFECHLKSDKLNAYGLTLLGLPSIAMGFNQDLGWGLTFNQADVMDLIELDIKENQYLVNGQWKSFNAVTEQIKIKQGDTLHTMSIVVRKSDFGFIVEEKGNKAIAFRLSGLDRPKFIQQFDGMAKSKNLSDFETAVSMLQLPLQNIIYADRHGDIYYIYNGIIPIRPGGTLQDWAAPIAHTKPGSLVESYLAYSDLPMIKNPISGFIANSNNSPWTSTFPFIQPSLSYPKYIAGQAFDHFDSRCRQSLKMILSKPKLSFEDLVQMQSSTHSELSDRTLDALVAYASSSSDTLLHAAANVLQQWDKKLDTKSKGAVLFANWYFASRKINMFSDGIDSTMSLQTPHILSDLAKAKLLDAARQTIAKYNRLDVSWGEVYKTNLYNQSYDGGLGLNEVGSFNAGFYRPVTKSTYGLQGGSAYTCVVEWGPKLKAMGILSYGNASQDNSLFKNNQINLMLNRNLRDIWFYEEDIDQHLMTKEILWYGD